MSDLGFCLYSEKRGSKINIFYAQLHSKKITTVQVSVQSNSLYYNILYINAHMHSKKRVKHYFGEKCILEGMKYTIF
jgi:hypothetical protein